MEDVLCPVSEVYPLKSKAVERPEDGSGLKPHLVLDEVHEGAKGKDEQPELSTVLVEVIPGKSNKDEKKEAVAKYSAVAEGVPEEKMPYRFINDVGEKRANKQEPYVYMICQGNKPRCSAIGGAVLGRNQFGRSLKRLPYPALSGEESVASGESTT